MTSPTLPPEAEALVQEAARTLKLAASVEGYRPPVSVGDDREVILRDLAFRLLEPHDRVMAELRTEKGLAMLCIMNGFPLPEEMLALRREMEAARAELELAKRALRGAIDRPAVALLDPDRPPVWLTLARAVLGQSK